MVDAAILPVCAKRRIRAARQGRTTRQGAGEDEVSAKLGLCMRVQLHLLCLLYPIYCYVYLISSHHRPPTIHVRADAFAGRTAQRRARDGVAHVSPPIPPTRPHIAMSIAEQESHL